MCQWLKKLLAVLREILIPTLKGPALITFVYEQKT